MHPRIARSIAAATCVLALGAAGAERTFTLVTVNGGVPAPQRVLRVARGDVVTMNFTANKPGEIHLHAYKLAAKIAPGRTETWKFTARDAGSFRIDWHAAGDASADHPGAALSTLEVAAR